MDFATLDEAMYEAAQAARSSRENRKEAMSVVYEHNGRFYFTEPQSQENDERVRADVKIPRSARVAGIVHNHPPGKDNDKFSPTDVEMAETLKVPSLIIYGDDASKEPTMRLFTPGKTKMGGSMGRGVGLRKRWSEGDEFVRFPKLHVGESVVNRIMNAADDLEAETDAAEAAEPETSE